MHPIYIQREICIKIKQKLFNVQLPQKIENKERETNLQSSYYFSNF